MTAAAAESTPLPHISDVPEEPMTARTIPIITPTIQMSAPSPGDPMEITTPTDSSPPGTIMSASKSPDRDTHDPPHGISTSATTPTSAAMAMANAITPTAATHSAVPGSNDASISASSSSPLGPPDTPLKMESHQSAPTGPSPVSIPAAAAPAVHQPKIVQTAFIHKLYNMLEDPNIQHLISWSNSAESFVMSPSHDFSKVLAQYFKHTNISSFVRQLNMYGFHKVSDVFANGSDSTTLWEFKHGNGNFKRGDLVGLREIKRRASRHSLVHRDYPGQKPHPPPPPQQPGCPPPETIPMSEGGGGDLRMNIDQAMFSFDSRLQRNEEVMHYMSIKHQAAMDMISRLLQFNQDLTRSLLNLVPNSDSTTYRDMVALQGEMQRQADFFRSLDEPHEPPFMTARPYLPGVENAPVSPRQLPQDDPRRATLAVPQPPPPQRVASNFYRPTVPSNLSVSTRRPYGSIGGGTTTQSSPSRTQLPPPPPIPPHTLAPMEPPANSLARRHTSADIRAHGWQTNPSNHLSPIGPGPPPGVGAGPGQPPGSMHTPPTQFPPSPNKPIQEDQRIRDSFSTYSLQAASQVRSRPETPPPPPHYNGSQNGNHNGVHNGSHNGSHNGIHNGMHNGILNGSHMPNHNGGSNGSSGTDLGSWSWGAAVNRNGSLSVKNSSAPPTRRGSMAHILNPTDLAERDDEDNGLRDDDRKRKRMV